MSTRSNLIIVTPENQAHQFYHHCDGYLSGVGEELRGFLNESANYGDLLRKLATPDEYGSCYEDEGKHDQSERDELHGDIEFLYVIKNRRLYYMEIHKSKDYKKLKTYKELIDYICIAKHEIDLTKEATDKGYIYEDNKPEDYETTKTEVKTMNYEVKKAELENKIKELQNELENLKKQESKEAWKKSLVEKFKEFIESTDFAAVEAVEIKARTKNPAFSTIETYFFNESENIEPAKVESEPTAEPEPIKEPEKPENKIIIAGIPKPEEPKKKMTLDEFIDSLPEPATK